GKKNGLYESYNDKGIKIEEGNFKSDYKNGIWKRYDSRDGHLLYETTFADNVKNGIAKEYNKANKVSAEGMFKNNEKNGVWKHYNLAGKLKKEVSYNLGKEISTKAYK
ncbi:MAG: toxin-antitoxin system YwqK family antitoxin, partial [Flavobacteriales bacterium]